jgi:type IV pilus assembly protein PilC
MTYQGKAVFYRELGTMLKAGLSLLTALGHLKSSGSNAHIYRALYEGVYSGEPFAGVAASFSPQVFSVFEVATLRAGEASGTLPVILDRLGDYFDFIHRTRARIISGLVYPVILLHAAIIIPAVPLLILRGFGPFLAATLPVLIIIYGVAATLIFLVKKLQTPSPFSCAFSRVIIGLPIVGPLTKKTALLRFLQAFVCLYSAGIGVVEAVQLSARTMGNPVMEQEMLKAVALLRGSATIPEAFADNAFFPPVVREMLSIGAVSGKMDETLSHVIGYMQEEVKNTVTKLIAVLPVVVYLIVAGYIGYIIIKFYVGYFSQINSLTGW